MTRDRLGSRTFHLTASIHHESAARGTSTPAALPSSPAMMMPLLRSLRVGVLRAGAPPAIIMSWRTWVPVTRSEATVERWMEAAARTTRTRRSRRSGPPADSEARRTGPNRRRTRDRSRRTAGGGGSGRPTTSIRNAGGAFKFTNRTPSRMKTLGVQLEADIACVSRFYICTWAVTVRPSRSGHHLDSCQRTMSY
jgi:hypothetical protein